MNNCILKSLSVENFASFADKIQFTTLIDSRKKDTTDFTMCINDELYNKVIELGIFKTDTSGKFIDFRNDWYKRTSRALQEIDTPTLRYADIIKIYKAWFNAKIQANWNLKEIYLEDFINKSGADWNFDQHKKIDTIPTLSDFKKTVSDYLAWEVSNLLKNDNSDSLGK